MAFITRDNTTKDDGLLDEYTAFASDIGIAPGPFPRTIETDLGNKLQFIAMRKKVIDGDLQYVRYEQALGCVTLFVFND